MDGKLLGLGSLAGAGAALALHRLLVQRLWLDVAARGLRRYLADSARGEIRPADLVLDIGGGDRPHIRADVVCDRYEVSWERSAPLLRDRPLVIGDINHLPFKRAAFDYVISQHLMEHLPEPETACRELARIGRRGLIRTPSPLAEKLISRDVHRWYVSSEAGQLVFRQKEAAFFDEGLTRGLWSDASFWHWFGTRVDAMETVHRWSGEIQHRVERRRSASWDGEPFLKDDDPEEAKRGPGVRHKLRGIGTRWAGRAYRQGLLRRPRAVDLEALLACPRCGGAITLAATSASCEGACSSVYPVRLGVPIMLIEEATSTRQPTPIRTFAATGG
ncbi:MAG: methyltransferase domain-containing protein [Dehalococcoidia bacterium]